MSAHPALPAPSGRPRTAPTFLANPPKIRPKLSLASANPLWGFALARDSSPFTPTQLPPPATRPQPHPIPPTTPRHAAPHHPASRPGLTTPPWQYPAHPSPGVPRRVPESAKKHPAAPQEFFGKNSYAHASPLPHPPHPTCTIARFARPSPHVPHPRHRHRRHPHRRRRARPHHRPRRRLAQNPTTHADLAIGISAAIRGLDGVAPNQISLVTLSTTLATNAAIEGLGGRVCALLIGYDESMLRRYGLAHRIHAAALEFIPGRHDVFGEERAPLDEDALRRAVDRWRDRVDAFAISSYLSVRNPSTRFGPPRSSPN